MEDNTIERVKDKVPPPPQQQQQPTHQQHQPQQQQHAEPQANQHLQHNTLAYNVAKSEANALRDHIVGREVVKAPVETEELIPSQYINIHHVPDVVNSKSFLTNSSLLSGNELLVDINGDLISSGSIALERYMPHQYEDDLLHDELTEDDKRLAAALVAVQLVTQQKQQSGAHILPMLAPTTLPVTSKLVNLNEPISVMPSLSGPNKQSGDQVIVNTGNVSTEKTGVLQNFVQESEETSLPPLPPLKKVLSKNRYLRQNFNHINQSEEDHQAHLASLGIHTEQIEISTEEIEIESNDVIKTELNDFIIEEETNIKTEICEESEQLSEEEQESDGGVHNSDYENGGDKSKNSLPHKKRIPRKLKNPQKSPPSMSVNADEPGHIQLVKINSYKCNKCSEFFTNVNAFTAHKATHNVKRTGSGVNQSSPSSFSCELCFKNFTNQWKFFEHLKSHYEPIELDSNSLKRVTPTPSKTNVTYSDVVVKKEVKNNAPKAKTVQSPTVQSPNTKGTTLVKTKSPTASNQVAATPQPVSKWPASPSQPQQSQEVTVASSILYQQLTQNQTEQIFWECEPCKRIFRRQKTYETHLSVAHPKQEEIEEFSDPEDMMEGIRVEVHSDDEKETTEKETTIQKEWYREEDLHAAEADLQEMEARTKTVYVDAHMCGMCNEAYHSKAALNQHISQQHAELMTAITKTVRRQPDGSAKKGSLHCKECGRFFHHRNSLVYHLKSHLGERPYQCEVCGKGFFATSALKVHMRQHSGVKPFKCEFCGRNFRQWGDLKYHCISIHSDQKNFQCEYCGKDFARKYSLTVHSRIHTGERNYKCEFCDKSFRASSYLQNHRRIHTGEKPHPCDVCGKPFRVRSDMKRHMITHSKEPYSAFVMKTKRENQAQSNTEDAKLAVQVDEQIPEISKVEELEVSTVESILPDEAVTASNRLQEELSVTYSERDPLETVARETNTLYVWPVYTT
ncbi:hypothetical protein RUM44_007975 [Polyplax serrata]|uniref:C2H2-type domain-containing protein n=1 Tax=Polyplax serrata TaxID=468196 RepID=A0ABR1B7H3_POLSC